MQISLNNKPIRLPQNCTIADLLSQNSIQPPFAVALNTRFIAKQYYAQTPLHDGDKVDVVKPVAGG